MAVIEKHYSDTTELNTIIQENLPEWLHAEGDESVLIANHPYRIYRLKNNDETEYMDLGVLSEATTSSYSSMFAFAIHSDKNEVELSKGFTKNDSTTPQEGISKNSSGIVRIIIKDKMFAISLLSTEYEVRVGVIISFVGSVSDGNFYLLYSSTAASTSGADETIRHDGTRIWGMSATNIIVKPIYNTYGNQTVLIPCCDYAHGNTVPIQSVYMPIIREPNAPNVLYDGSKKYYKVTAYRSSSESFPFYVEE